MMRPRKMKRLEFTVLKDDFDAVMECLGRMGIMHFSPSNKAPGTPSGETEIRGALEPLKGRLNYLGLEIPFEPYESSRLPRDEDRERLAAVSAPVDSLEKREQAVRKERGKAAGALDEARSFVNLNAPFSRLDQLSYLTLRIGRLDPARQDEVKASLGDRAVLIPLGEGKFAAAASRKGRFALDSELSKRNFTPLAIPENFTGLPSELLSGLEKHLDRLDRELEDIEAEKKALGEKYGAELQRLCASCLMAAAVENLRAGLSAGGSVYVISGWVPAKEVKALVDEILKVSGGRAAVFAYNPNELEAVRAGREKVPVVLNHGAFVKGFEPLVFSYGAPLYGTIDPTPIVAFFYTIIFGIMFGDLGQGLVLLILGLLSSRRGLKVLEKFRVYSTPLIAVGIAAMIMGFLDGEVFAQEGLLEGPTRAISGFLFGREQDQFIHLMPQRGNVTKLFYFFGFTISVGVVLNSLGLLINIVNRWALRQYSEVFFSKTGLAGLAFFWYALFIALRILLGGRFYSLDFIGLGLPVFCIAFGPLLYKCFSGKSPLKEEGLLVFIIEGIVEIIETVSSYFSNTVSFLRVGAFALSHAVLTFIVFTFSGLAGSGAGGPFLSFIIILFGNLVIIVLEGMIVAIQVVRLQYYEFFSKFFTETGVPYRPFAFRGGENPDRRQK